MNQEAYSLIKGALSQKRQGSNRGANRDTLLSVLEQERIKTDMNMKPIEFLMRMMGKPCFPRGELVAVTGKAKSGKTFFTSMLMAACTADGIEGIERLNGLPPLKCLWYDTEQSRQSTLEILKERIVPLAGGTGAESSFGVRRPVSLVSSPSSLGPLIGGHRGGLWLLTPSKLISLYFNAHIRNSHTVVQDTPKPHTEPMEQREQCELAQTLSSRERLRVGELSSGIRGRQSQITEMAARWKLRSHGSHRSHRFLIF